MRHVFEFRDPTWITEEVLELLGEKGASFCAHDMPNVPTPRWATGPIAYVRFHGASGKYWGRYSKEVLCSELSVRQFGSSNVANVQHSPKKTQLFQMGCFTVV